MIRLLLIAMLVLPSAALAAKKQTKPSGCRDATTGQYVTAAFAKAHPDSTVCETKTDAVKKKQG